MSNEKELVLIVALIFLVGYVFILSLLPKGISKIFAIRGKKISSHDLRTKYVMGITVRILGVLVFLPILKYFGALQSFTYNINVNCWILSWLFFVYIIANLEIGSVKNATPGLVVLMALEGLAIGFYEEFLFRGVLLRQFMQVFATKRGGVICAVLLSSFAFGLFHLMNLRSSKNVVGVLTQVCYTTMMGVGFSALLIRTEWNLLWCGLIHGLYDIASGFGDFSAVRGEDRVVPQNKKVSIKPYLINMCLFIPLMIYGLFLLRKV